MLLYDLQERRHVEVTPQEGATLLHQNPNRFTALPSRNYNVGNRAGNFETVKGSDLGTYLQNDYMLTKKQPEKGENISADPRQKTLKELAKTDDPVLNIWKQEVNRPSQFQTGFSDMFLGGVGQAIGQATSPEYRQHVKETQADPSWLYRAGQAVGLAAELPIVIASAGKVNALTRGSKIASKVMNVANKSKMGRDYLTGTIWTGIYGSLTGTAEAIRNKDPWAVAEHVAWGSALGGPFGVVLGKLGRGAVGGAAKFMGWLGYRSFRNATKLSEKELLKHGAKDKKEARTLIEGARVLVDKAVRDGKLTGKSTAEDVLKVVRESLDKTGKLIGHDKKTTQNLQKFINKSFDTKVTIADANKMQRWGSSTIHQLEVISKLDSAYKLGITKLSYTKNKTVGRKFSELMNVTTSNIKQFSNKFDGQKYAKDMKELKIFIEKTEEIVKKNKGKLSKKDYNNFFKRTALTKRSIDKFSKGENFKSTVKLSDVLSAMNKAEKNHALQQLKPKITSKMDEQILDLFSKQNTFEDFNKALKAQFKLDKTNFREVFKGTMFEDLSKPTRSATFDDFMRQARGFYTEYKNDIMRLSSPDYILKRLRNVLRPEGFSSIPGGAGSLYKKIEREISGSKTLSYSKINSLRRFIAEEGRAVFKKSGYDETSRANESLKKAVFVMRDIQDKVRENTIKLNLKMTGKSGALKPESLGPLNKTFSDLIPIKEVIAKEIKRDTTDMGRLVWGQHVGAGISGVATASIFGFSPLGIAAGTIAGASTGLLMSKYAPTYIQRGIERFAFQWGPYFRGIHSRMQKVDGYLEIPNKLNNLFARGNKVQTTELVAQRVKDKLVGSNATDVADFFGVPRRNNLNLEEIAVKVDQLLTNPEAASEVNRAEGEVLRSLDLGEVADASYIKKLQGLSILREQIPKRGSDIFNNKPRKFSKQDEHDFLKVFNIVHRPENAFKLLASGSMSYKQIDVFKNMYPKLYMKMSLKLAEMLQTNVKLSYRQKQNIRKFLGIPQQPDMTFRPQGDQGLPIDEAGETLIKKTVTGLGQSRERSIDRVEAL